MPFLTSISGSIKASARALGFDLAGIAPVEQFRELEYFPEWIAAGHHGEMQYLATRTEQGDLKRSSIQKAAPWARSIVVTAMNYNTSQPYSTEYRDKTRGWISRYAWGQRDYHDVILPKLRQLEEEIKEVVGDAKAARLKPRPFKEARRAFKEAERAFKEAERAFIEADGHGKGADLRFWSYVDTGPVVERVLAQHAGIGWVGKNTCIINQQLGSWLFLGVILTSIELEPDLPSPDRCGTCMRCLEACPTHAFLGPYKLDASKCISYLTIEKRGAIPEDLRDGMQNHLFGCDICQDVCPWNRKAPTTQEPAFQARPSLINPPLAEIAILSDDGFKERFRGSPVKRAKRTGIRRNAVIAMGNSGDRSFLPLLHALGADDDAAVAEAAQWAIQKLRQST